MPCWSPAALRKAADSLAANCFTQPCEGLTAMPIPALVALPAQARKKPFNSHLIFVPARQAAMAHKLSHCRLSHSTGSHADARALHKAAAVITHDCNAYSSITSFHDLDHRPHSRKRRERPCVRTCTTHSVTHRSCRVASTIRSRRKDKKFLRSKVAASTFGLRYKQLLSTKFSTHMAFVARRGDDAARSSGGAGA